MELRSLVSSVSLSWLVACARAEGEQVCMGSCDADDDGSTSSGDDDDDDAASEGREGSSSSGVGRMSESSTHGVEPSSTQDAESSSGAPGQCAELGEPCSDQEGCCPAPDGGRVCVAEPQGATCHDACIDDDECDSGCCVSLHGEMRACVAAEMCEHACAPLLAACADDGECCDGTACIDGACNVACGGASECPSGCCGDDGQCASTSACGGVDACAEGSHFCQGGALQFLCDDDGWYAVDCDAACVEAGFDGSSGCGYSDLYEDDVCLCA